MIFIMLASIGKNFGMIEIVPHRKIGPRLLCGRMDAVIKNLFFNSPLFSIFGFPTQKGAKMQIFMKIGFIELKLR